MSTRFLPGHDLIVVRAVLHGPKKKRTTLRLALDTGASRSVLPQDALLGVGYDLAQIGEQTLVTTGSGTVIAPLVEVSQLTAIAHSTGKLKVVAHTLPAGASVDGLLGLDFLRRTVLSIDFPKRLLTLVSS